MKQTVIFDFCVSEAKKKAGKFCCAYACNNKPVKKLGGLCYKHYQRKRRVLDPVGVRYNQWKQKAKQRGKEFNVTLAQFRDFCKNTGYILKPGKRGKNATIDRPENFRGYSMDNMQLLTGRQNVGKYYNYDRHQPPPENYDPGPGPPEYDNNDENDDLPF